MDSAVLDWLLEGDPGIRWQVGRDLLDWSPDALADERARIVDTGWGAELLALQAEDGQWAGGLYSPKWTSTTYTLLLLQRLGVPPGEPGTTRGATLLLDRGVDDSGGIDLWGPDSRSELCVTGMVLAIGSAFVPHDERLDRLARFALESQMPDGGWNCRFNRSGATHSSLHTTISILEGALAYEATGREVSETLRTARSKTHEFLAAHRLYRSHRTGEPIKKAFTMLSFPPRWHYDVLRGLDYLQAGKAPTDPRYADGIDLLRGKRRKDGRWPVQNAHAGKTHFVMEPTGGPSRWNTLRALRVLRWWDTG